MIPWELLDSSAVPGGSEILQLYRRDTEFSIRVDGAELMNSRVHGSEDALAERVCAGLDKHPSPQILIGGLGMGFTASAALQNLGDQARVVVAELVPAVVTWNRGALAHLAGRPLQDDRITVREIDVAMLIKEAHHTYDAIVLDVDNGPDGLTRSGNDWLYGSAGLHAARNALKPSGMLAVWSAAPDPVFTKRLCQSGFSVEEVTVRARGRKGSRHVIWLASK